MHSNLKINQLECVVHQESCIAYIENYVYSVITESKLFLRIIRKLNFCSQMITFKYISKYR